MTAVTDLTQQKCQDTQVMRTLTVLIAPFAPHIAEEMWHLLGGEGSVCDAQWPRWDESLLVEQEVKLQVAFNGKRRFEMAFPADAQQQQIEQTVLASAEAAKYVEGRTVKKVIVVPGRMVNIVM
jgi:leucyl-tRNA synthetase